jgi:hypothetical protein
MGAPIDDDLRQLLECGVAVVLGTHDGALTPEIARGWGLLVMPDRASIEVCVGMPSGRRTAANLAHNGRVALTCVRPTTYRQVQLKGRAVATLPPTDDDRARVDRHREAFAHEVEHVGIAREHVHNFWAHDDPAAMVKIRIAVEQAFDQTPGPDAGRRL